MVLTVKKLKEIVNKWPEITESGDESEVWIATGRMLSSPVVSYCKLGRGDLHLESNTFKDDDEIEKE